MVIINESGLYSLILSSKLPDAKKFKKWVTKEVLPSLRKDGYYEDTEWSFLRAVGIEDRLDMTSAIKAFKKHCKRRYVDHTKYIAYKHKNLYSTFSGMVNYMCNLPLKNDRDNLTKKQLKMLDTFESKIVKVIITDIADDKHPDKIFIHIKNALIKRRDKYIEKGLLKDTMIIDLYTFPYEDESIDMFQINEEEFED